MRALDRITKPQPATTLCRTWGAGGQQQLHLHHWQPGACLLSLPGTHHQLCRIVFHLVSDSSISGENSNDSHSNGSYPVVRARNVKERRQQPSNLVLRNIKHTSTVSLSVNSGRSCKLCRRRRRRDSYHPPLWAHSHQSTVSTQTSLRGQQISCVNSTVKLSFTKVCNVDHSALRCTGEIIRALSCVNYGQNCKTMTP